MKRLDPKCGLSNNTANTTARKSLCVVASLCSTLVSVCDQYPIGRAARSFCCCRSMPPTRKWHTSVSTICSPVVHGSTRTNRSVSSLFRYFTAFVLGIVSEGIVMGWFFRTFFFKGAAIIEMFCTNRRNSFQTPGRNLSTDCLVGFLSLNTAAAIASDICRHPDCMNCSSS